jgi:uncharacterized protein (TIGR00299 family) protein
MSSQSSPDAAPAASSLAIHLDLVGGIAGDMFAAAMIDALPSLAKPMQDELERVRPDGAARPAFEEASSAGLRARRLVVDTNGAKRHAHGMSYESLRRTIADAGLSPATREHALALLSLLGEAEASVHGVPIDDVHFHELADWDSLLDVVAAGCIAGLLDGARWSASALPLGGGTIRTAHGVLPVPGPATAWLLRGYEWRDDGIAGERVTPTGAAIIRHLVPASRCGGERDGGKLFSIGHGAGTRTMPGVPNIVRVLVLERTAVADTDAIAVLEFDVDDMTGEEIAAAADRLRTEPGVIDVSMGTRSGKKGRPLADFRVLAQPYVVDAVAHACFVETSTIGLRIRDVRRRILPRTEAKTPVGDATVSVKIAQRPDGERTAKTAHDDVADARGLAERRGIRAAGERRALKDEK